MARLIFIYDHLVDNSRGENRDRVERREEKKNAA